MTDVVDALVDYLPDDGTWISTADLADAAGVSYNTARVTLRAMRFDGWVVRRLGANAKHMWRLPDPSPLWSLNGRDVGMTGKLICQVCGDPIADHYAYEQCWG